MKEKKKENIGVFGAFVMIICGLLAAMQTGCVIKKVQAWPPSIEFQDGVDFHIGTNGVDSVNDNRGLGKERPVARY